jgi:hypothetical protein
MCIRPEVPPAATMSLEKSDLKSKSKAKAEKSAKKAEKKEKKEKKRKSTQSDDLGAFSIQISIISAQEPPPISAQRTDPNSYYFPSLYRQTNSLA